MKVDILMATYNGEKYLREQIDSILHQSYSNFTLYISDDLSKDSTREILKEYEQKDSRIRLYFQEKNLGYIKNFEYLISISKADYVMLSDQDDVWLEDKVELSLTKIEEEKLNLVISDLIVVDKSLNIIQNSYFHYLNLKINNNVDFGSFLFRNPATGCTMIFDRYLINKILPFPNLKHPHYVHDWYIFMMGQAYGKVGYIDTPLIQYRQHGNNNIGMNRTKKRSLSFLQIARSINLNYRIEFCDALMQKISNEKTDSIMAFKKYLLKLKQTKIINFDWKSFFQYSEAVGWKTKLKFFFVFHFPLCVLSKEEKLGE